VPRFLKPWLDTRLPQKVRIAPVKFNGVSDYCGEIAKVAHLNLSGVRGSDVIAGIGLLDLYGLETCLSFPVGKVSVRQRYTWAKRELERLVDHPNFRQHFAVHEIEAWLLSDADIFPSEVRRDLAAGSKAPERVNFNNPPAQLLHTVYRDRLGRRYQKAVYGPDLFLTLDPERARGKCPYLKSMLDDMVALANSAVI
jgi:hypothetical protein